MASQPIRGDKHRLNRPKHSLDSTTRATGFPIPTGAKLFNWLFTMFRGRIRFETPMLWTVSFMVTFVIGGMTGVLLATPFAGLPLIVCGVLKIVYDVALLYSFRHIKPPEEQG